MPLFLGMATKNLSQQLILMLKIESAKMTRYVQVRSYIIETKQINGLDISE